MELYHGKNLLDILVPFLEYKVCMKEFIFFFSISNIQNLYFIFFSKRLYNIYQLHMFLFFCDEYMDNFQSYEYIFNMKYKH